MSHFLESLMARSFGAGQTIKPRLPSRFEPLPPGRGSLGEGMAWPEEETRNSDPDNRVGADWTPELEAPRGEWDGPAMQVAPEQEDAETWEAGLEPSAVARPRNKSRRSAEAAINAEVTRSATATRNAESWQRPEAAFSAEPKVSAEPDLNPQPEPSAEPMRSVERASRVPRAASSLLTQVERVKSAEAQSRTAAVDGLDQHSDLPPKRSGVEAKAAIELPIVRHEVRASPALPSPPGVVKPAPPARARALSPAPSKLRDSETSQGRYEAERGLRTSERRSKTAEAGCTERQTAETRHSALEPRMVIEPAAKYRSEALLRPRPALTAQASEPVIQISIGRIEVRAIPQTASDSKSRATSPVMSLQEYLQRRSKAKL
jgi:hypothetical protein